MDLENGYVLKQKKSLMAIRDLKDERADKYTNWLRNIIAMAVGFLGISVGLKSQIDSPHNSIYTYLFWNLQLLSLSFGILFGTIRLYGDIHLMDSHVADLWRKIEERSRYRQEEDFPATNIPLERVYKISEIICYISFVIALICVLVVSLLSGFE